MLPTQFVPPDLDEPLKMTVKFVGGSKDGFVTDAVFRKPPEGVIITVGEEKYKYIDGEFHLMVDND